MGPDLTGSHADSEDAEANGVGDTEVLNPVVECRRTDIPTVAQPTDGFLSEAHNGLTTLPPTRKDRIMHRDIFSLSEPQLPSEQQPIATQSSVTPLWSTVK